MTATTPRVLRADAERNLARVLDAAREVFAEHGLDAPRDARSPSVPASASATIFRRFPTKDDLLAALLAQRGEQLDRGRRRARSSSDDPGAAFRGARGGDHGDADPRPRLLRRDRHRSASPARSCRSSFDGVRSAARRAAPRGRRTAGAVRPDVTAEDVLFVLYGVARTGLMLEDAAPGAWRRYLALALDGLQARGGRRCRGRPPTRRQFEAARCGS